MDGDAERRRAAFDTTPPQITGAASKVVKTRLARGARAPFASRVFTTFDAAPVSCGAVVSNASPGTFSVPDHVTVLLPESGPLMVALWNSQVPLPEAPA